MNKTTNLDPEWDQMQKPVDEWLNTPEGSFVVSKETIEKIKREENKKERFGLNPIDRIGIATGVGFFLGFMSGSLNGIRIAKKRHLAENAHRAPTNKYQWYFYHKTKNYVVLKGAFSNGFSKAFKYSGFLFGISSLEATIDYMRGGRLDFLSSLTATVFVGGGNLLFKNMGYYQTVKGLKQLAVFGLLYGLFQDGMRYYWGHPPWYISKIKQNKYV